MQSATLCKQECMVSGGSLLTLHTTVWATPDAYGCVSNATRLLGKQRFHVSIEQCDTLFPSCNVLLMALIVGVVGVVDRSGK